MILTSSHTNHVVPDMGFRVRHAQLVRMSWDGVLLNALLHSAVQDRHIAALMLFRLLVYRRRVRVHKCVYAIYKYVLREP